MIARSALRRLAGIAAAQRTPMRFAGSTRQADMRSDTVTKPDAEMTVAMLDSPTGDDVMGEGEGQEMHEQAS
jgi:hypothetical protein